MFEANQSSEKKDKCRFESVVKLIIWCMPSLILLLISILWIGILPNRDSLPSFLAIAMTGLIVTRIIFLLRSQRKAGNKAALFIVWIVIFLVVGFFGLFMPRTIHRVIKADAQSRFEADIPHLFLESVSAPIEVGTTESIEYHTVSMSALIFESRSWILLCQYNGDEYERAFASLEERFHFRTELLGTGYYDDNHVEIVDDPYTVIGNERFRMLDPGDGDISYFYKGCFLIMTNDTKHQIAYIAFSDDDLDMTKGLEELINEYCGWKYLHL
ncbi:MAG: hypothetical protein IKS31_05090 [Clostridia bacterium]|nr:hypothetical protein [Clostridia bacterium]